MTVFNSSLPLNKYTLFQVVLTFDFVDCVANGAFNTLLIDPSVDLFTLSLYQLCQYSNSFNARVINWWLTVYPTVSS